MPASASLSGTVCRLLLMLLALMLLALSAGGAAAAADPKQAGYEYYAIGDPAAERPGQAEAGLMLLGGGDWPYEAFRWLARKAGNGRIVVLRASYTTEAQDEIYRKVGGVTAVQTLVFHAREAASDPRVLDIVAKADGIFIAGGDQSNYVRYWKGTPLAAALDRHVREGKPLGGTSAGLAIQGAWSYGAMDGGSLVSEVALRDPYGPQVTLVDDFLHLPWLEHVITDSHFGKRERLGRLIAWVARLRARDARIVGLGIDENTALCIDAQGRARVFTDTGGAAWLVRPQAPASVLEAGKPLSIAAVRVTGIGAASSIDMGRLQVENPAFERVADVRQGRLAVREARPTTRIAH